MESRLTRSPPSALQRALTRGRRAAPGSAVVLAALTAIAIAGSVPLAILDHQFWISVVPDALSIAFGATGLVIARRQPRNAVGPILLVTGLLILLCTFEASSYVDLVYRHHRGAWPAGGLAVVLGQFWLAPLLLGPLVILLFPDGELPSRRWRWVLRAYIAAAVALQGSQALVGLDAVVSGNVRIDSNGNLANSGPKIFSNPALGIAGAILVAFVAVCWFAFVGAQVWSFRRATGVRRQQLKWVMCGAAITAGSIPCFISLGGSSSIWIRAVSFLSVLGLAALPVTIGVGILKHGLYEIDRLISRTLSYAIVTGVLVGLYFGLVSLATDALPISSPVGVAASTLAAAALFNPLRTRVQRAVDRRFNRMRYDGEATLVRFHADLRDAVDVDTVEHLLLTAVSSALQPSHSSIWIRARRG